MKCPECGSENVTIEMVQTAGKTAKHGTGLGGKINNTARAITAVSTNKSSIGWMKDEKLSVSLIVFLSFLILAVCLRGI